MDSSLTFYYLYNLTHYTYIYSRKHLETYNLPCLPILSPIPTYLLSFLITSFCLLNLRFFTPPSPSQLAGLSICHRRRCLTSINTKQFLADIVPLLPEHPDPSVSPNTSLNAITRHLLRLDAHMPLLFKAPISRSLSFFMVVRICLPLRKRAKAAERRLWKGSACS